MITKEIVMSLCMGAFGILQANEKHTMDMETIWSLHYPTLSHTQVSRKPFMICFSGTPGMGKTHLAQILAERYQAVRISTDEIRKIMSTFDIPFAREELVEKYLAYFYAHYHEQNQFLILDAAIDRRYKTFFPFLERHHIPYITIRLELSQEEVIKRLTARENELIDKYLAALPSWWNDYADFGNHFFSMYRMNTEKHDNVALNKLYDTIENMYGLLYPDDALLTTSTEI